MGTYGTHYEHASDSNAYIHAKNKIAGRFILFSVLGFWDKNTGICAGAMPYRRDFSRPLPGSRHLTQKKA
jgi:hypothetical protein